MSEDKAIRRLAVLALGDFGPDAAEFRPTLTRLLRDPDPDVRSDALSSLRLVGPTPEAIPAIRELLHSENSGARMIAAEFLGDLGANACVAVSDLLRVAQSDTSPFVRAGATYALARVASDDPAVAEALSVILVKTEELAFVRGLAARALGKVQNLTENAHNRLAMIAEMSACPSCWVLDPERSWEEERVLLKLDAVAAFSNHAPLARFPTCLVEAFQRNTGSATIRTRIAEIWSEQPSSRMPRAIDLMIKSISAWRAGNSKEHRVAFASINTLGTVPAPSRRIVDELSLAVSAGGGRHTHAALAALAELGSAASTARDRIEQMLRSPKPDVRVLAAEVLWRMGSEASSVLPVLSECLETEATGSPFESRFVRRKQGAWVRAKAASLLAEIGPPARCALPILEKCREDEFGVVRSNAKLAIEAVNRRDEGPGELSKLIAKPDGVQAAIALQSHFASLSIDEISRLRQHPNPTVAIYAAWRQFTKNVANSKPVLADALALLGWIESRIGCEPPPYWRYCFLRRCCDQDTVSQAANQEYLEADQAQRDPPVFSKVERLSIPGIRDLRCSTPLEPGRGLSGLRSPESSMNASLDPLVLAGSIFHTEAVQPHDFGLRGHAVGFIDDDDFPDAAAAIGRRCMIGNR